MRAVRATGLAVIVTATVALIAPGQASAAKALNGRCGMHIGKLISRNSQGSTYHFRIGPKVLGSLRPGTCRGYVRVAKKNASGQLILTAGALAWQHYSMLGFNRKTALWIPATIGTVGGCTAAARYMVTGISILVDGATEGAAFPGVMLMAGTVGCGVGANKLYDWLTSGGPSTLDDVRMVK
jgi:hypothetical protein